MAATNPSIWNSADDTEITAINYGTGDAGSYEPSSAGTEYHIWNDKGNVLSSSPMTSVKITVRDSDGNEVDNITVQKWVEVKSTTIHAGADGGSTSGYTDDNMSDFQAIGKDGHLGLGDIPYDCYRKVFIRVNIPNSAIETVGTFKIYVTNQQPSSSIAKWFTGLFGDGVVNTGNKLEVTNPAGADSNIAIASGYALINDNEIYFGSAQTYTLSTTDATYKVYLTKEGVISSTTGSIPSNSIQLASVVIASNVVDSVTDTRVYITLMSDLDKTDGNFIVADGTNWVVEIGATARASLGLTIGTHVQAYDASLTSIAGLTYASASFIKLTAEDTYAVRTITEVKTDLAYQLSDMSDIGVTTPTNKNALMGDGDSWESRVLVEADISDLGTYLTGITGESIGDLSDVDLTDIADLKVLKYNNSTSKWECEDAGGGYTNLTQFVSQTAWRVFYSNTDGDVVELALGADGTYLKSNGAAAAPTFTTPAGAGDVVAPASNTDNTISRWNGVDSKALQDSLVSIDDSGSVDIPSGQSYKIDGTPLTVDVVGDTTPQLGGNLDCNDHAILENVTIKTAIATLTIAEAGMVLISCAASPYTITLPTPIGNTGLCYKVKKTDFNYNLITMATVAGQFNYENADSALKDTYPRLNTGGAEATFKSDGSNWQVTDEALGQVPIVCIESTADILNLGSGGWHFIPLDDEIYDIGSNYDVSEWISGTADGTVTNHLQDDTASPFTAAMVGYRVKNTTDSTYAWISAFNDAGDVTLTENIFVNGEGYQIMNSKFVVPVSGMYFISASLAYDSVVVSKRYITGVHKNGSNLRAKAEHSGIAEFIYPNVVVQEPLAKDDYIQLTGIQLSGVNTVDIQGAAATYIQISLLSKD